MKLLSLLVTTIAVPHVAVAFSLTMLSAAGKTKTAVIAGATGYIGKSTVREAQRQGYHTVALVRDVNKVKSKEGEASYGQFFEGAEVVECDVTDPSQLTKVRLGVVDVTTDVE